METDDEELANISFDCFSKVVALSELNDDVVLLTPSLDVLLEHDVIAIHHSQNMGNIVPSAVRVRRCRILSCHFKSDMDQERISRELFPITATKLALPSDHMCDFCHATVQDGRMNLDLVWKLVQWGLECMHTCDNFLIICMVPMYAQRLMYEEADRDCLEQRVLQLERQLFISSAELQNVTTQLVSARQQLNAHQVQLEDVKQDRDKNIGLNYNLQQQLKKMKSKSDSEGTLSARRRSSSSTAVTELSHLQSCNRELQSQLNTMTAKYHTLERESASHEMAGFDLRQHLDDSKLAHELLQSHVDAVLEPTLQALQVELQARHEAIERLSLQLLMATSANSETFLGSMSTCDTAQKSAYIPVCGYSNSSAGTNRTAAQSPAVFFTPKPPSTRPKSPENSFSTFNTELQDGADVFDVCDSDQNICLDHYGFQPSIWHIPRTSGFLTADIPISVSPNALPPNNGSHQFHDHR